jgi:uncharacterized protein (DUF1697 family)
VARYVALVRGINVGRAKRVAMSDLRELLEGLDYAGVRTLLNSGNVVFSAKGGKPEAMGRRIEAGLSTGLGVSARVLVLTAEVFSRVVEQNVLAAQADDPARLFVAFCGDSARLRKLTPLPGQKWQPEALAVGSFAAYLWCPDGIATSDLAEAVGRVLSDSTTARNWATVLKIHAALKSGPGSGPKGPPGPRRNGGGKRERM